MVYRHPLTVVLLALAPLLSASEVFAQYDRDGRYVPSPMGVPSDPNARVVPGYPGTPGGSEGTPIWPRDTAPRLSPMTPRVGTDDRILTSRTVPLNKKRCAAGWNKKLGITSAEFEIRCAKIRGDD